MPRPRKGAHLYFREGKGKWVIKDGSYEENTGLGRDEYRAAERALQVYLAAKHRPDFGVGDPAQVAVADVLTLYADEKAADTRRPDIVIGALPHLSTYWGNERVSGITPGACRAYARWRTAMPQARFKDPETAPRVGLATARRELEVLSAALGYAYKEHKLRYPVPVTLPDKAPPRDRWLTRDEAARLIWAALRAEQGKSRHLARFIIVGLYTGTRHDAILKLRWLPTPEGGWVDLKGRILYRRGQGESESSKRRTPVPISDRLLAHLARWKCDSVSYVVEYRDAPLERMRRAWTTARKAAGLGPEVTPHILRHTFATWAVQDGMALGKVAAALGTTEQIVQSVYGHHNPHQLRDVVESVSRRRK